MCDLYPSALARYRMKKIADRQSPWAMPCLVVKGSLVSCSTLTHSSTFSIRSLHRCSSSGFSIWRRSSRRVFSFHRVEGF